jgi:hypothetical protein
MQRARQLGRLVAPAVVLAGLGCDALWNRANRSGLERDLRGVLERHGVPPAALRCRMVGSGHTGVCIADLAAGQPEQLAQQLALVPTAPGSACAPQGWAPGAERVVALGSASRPAALKLPHGGAFERLILHKTAAGPRVCLELQYAD